MLINSGSITTSQTDAGGLYSSTGKQYDKVELKLA